MHQQWLTVMGLGLDFVGFCLLLREWWIAFFHESRRLQQEAQEAWQRSVRRHHLDTVPQAHRGHLETANRMQDEMAFRANQASHKAALGARKAVFLTASVLIVAGFLLQLAGSIPGCCEPWIIPQSF